MTSEQIDDILERLDQARAEIMDPENISGNSMIQRERVFRLGDYLISRWPQIRDRLTAANATIEALQADLAGTAELLLREQALAESRSLALATMRERFQTLAEWTCDEGGWRIFRYGQPPPEGIFDLSDPFDPDVLAQPADAAAAALAGAVLKAADRMGRALDALVLGDATPVEAHAMLDAYREARAALRGDTTTASGEG
jgi:hypothetical protein